MGTDTHAAHERLELQERLAAWLDVPLTALAFIMLGLLVAQFLLPLSPSWQTHVDQAQTAIWAIFAVDFAFELLLAPSKVRYLKQNWLTAVSVLLPAFRTLRVVRVARALRGVSLLRLLTTLNRGGRALEHVARRGQLGYVLGLTLLVTAGGAAGVYFFESGEPDALIHTPGDALWWAATLITTVNSPLAVVTLEGRLVAMLLRVYALAVSGYITAVIAVQLFGLSQRDHATDAHALEALLEEMHLLRNELAEVRRHQTDHRQEDPQELTGSVWPNRPGSARRTRGQADPTTTPQNGR
ncbi:MAG: ion transporter [Chloroflexota bacterium]|nr:ion transporter [Chloroflexota bacterium]